MIETVYRPVGVRSGSIWLGEVWVWRSNHEETEYKLTARLQSTIAPTRYEAKKSAVVDILTNVSR